jgi:hypothetical protein
MKKGSFIHFFIHSIKSINSIKGSIKEQQRPLWDKEKANVTGRKQTAKQIGILLCNLA